MLDLLLRALETTIPVLVTVFLGLFLAGMLMELGVLDRLSVLSKPLVSMANLPSISASSFLVSLGSAVAANSMIAEFKMRGAIDDRETVLCAMMNSIPVYIREIFTYQIPVVVPLLGPVVGLFYAGVFIITAIVKVLMVIILGRLILRGRNGAEISWEAPRRNINSLDATLKILRTQIRPFARISITYMAMTLLVLSLNDHGFFDKLSVLPIAQTFGISPEALVPLTTYVASPLIGLSMLSPMIQSGSLTEIQAATVLMLGSMFMLPIFAMKSMVPNYTAIFGPRVGLMIVAISTGLSVMVRAVFLLALLWIG
ncbi:MAG: nucleoside recognition protein [Methanothrix sp.]|uniref:Nucleoside recognition domain protein n=1 Tax=Methanothrix thermoacetophila (strain DSM 6194 / JCM 14653 / NBRC 101360 / PT) TaxID=349307 RepID=A0B679_METTP|nr:MULTISPECIES: nucleoside recognition protein [Methanothrix]ABK14203.1 nucleoside recognition domain protein [Methanothrix thermoacetophila PT]MBC7079699.1 nucleoside recognition protein [Methanothrix sp.]NPU87774.1 nucleoside recognition protein [Methanothrix sp.]